MTVKIHSILLPVFIFSAMILCTGCHLKEPLPVPGQNVACHKIKIAPGPEDFVLDLRHGAPRILVSSHDRRNPETSGGIFYLNLDTEATGEMKRVGEPATLTAFKPHGMDIRQSGEEVLLYVILHDPAGRMKSHENAIVVYLVEGSCLHFRYLLEDAAHLWSPNDLSVLPGGEIYVTNDRRNDLDMYFKRESSEIVYYQPETRTWSTVADKLAFANGIYAETDRVFVTETLGEGFLMFPRLPDGRLGPKDIIARMKGGDNIMKYGDYFLTTAHYDDLAFMKHKKNPENQSPSVVFRVRPEFYSKEAMYVNNGEMISAASTAMVFNNKIYISQVFDPYIVVCDVPVYVY
ncbi:MAG: hypothetical protein Q7U02_15315 [Desulfosalsimonadaceae bacterium]|nr:hypothetical protein [Desulfosalsimonadaceae bacterium]